MQETELAVHEQLLLLRGTLRYCKLEPMFKYRFFIYFSIWKTYVINRKCTVFIKLIVVAEGYVPMKIRA